MIEERETAHSPSAPLRALIVASAADTRHRLRDLLNGCGLGVREAESESQAREIFGWEPFDLVVLVEDVLCGSGQFLIEAVRAFDEATVVVAVVDSTEWGKRALAAGAYDVFLSPLDGERFAVLLGHIAEMIQLRKRSAVLDRLLDGGAHLGGLLTRDPHMIAVLDAIRRLARYRVPVLVVGERGTEHEEVARALHELGRPAGPFVGCDAAALNAEELRAHHGAAAGGTLFIDDINALAASVSGVLTAVLEEAEAASDSGPPRIVVGCPQAMPLNAGPGDPRADLHRRLGGTMLVLSPLRDRRDDALLVARELAAGIGRERGRDLAIAQLVAETLLSYPWPGNLHELKTVVVAAATAAKGSAIEIHDLPASFVEHVGGTGQNTGTRHLRDLEVQHLRQVLEETHGNKSRAARVLGLSRWALQRKIRKHGIVLEEDPTPGA